MEKYLLLIPNSVPPFQYNVPKFIEDILYYLKKYISSKVLYQTFKFYNFIQLITNRIKKA